MWEQTHPHFVSPCFTRPRLWSLLHPILLQRITAHCFFLWVLLLWDQLKWDWLDTPLKCGHLSGLWLQSRRDPKKNIVYYIILYIYTTSCSSTTDNSVAAALCCTQPGLCGCAPMASSNALDVWVLEQESKLPIFPFLSFRSKIQGVSRGDAKIPSILFRLSPSILQISSVLRRIGTRPPWDSGWPLHSDSARLLQPPGSSLNEANVETRDLEVRRWKTESSVADFGIVPKLSSLILPRNLVPLRLCNCGK